MFIPTTKPNNSQLYMKKDAENKKKNIFCFLPKLLENHYKEPALETLEDNCMLNPQIISVLPSSYRYTVITITYAEVCPYLIVGHALM